MHKILHARLQHCVDEKFLDVQAEFRKWRRTRDQIDNIHWIVEKARESPLKNKQTNKQQQQKTTSVSLTTTKPLTVWIIINHGKLLKRWEYQTILPVSWETCMWVKKQELELCMEQPVGSRLRKKYDRAVCSHPVCLIYTLSTLWKCLAGWVTSWNQDRWEKHQQPQIWWWCHSSGKKWRGTKELLDEVGGGE